MSYKICYHCGAEYDINAQHEYCLECESTIYTVKDIADNYAHPLFFEEKE